MLRVNLLIHVHTAGLRRDLRVFRSLFRKLPVHLTITAFRRSPAQRLLRAVRRLRSEVVRRPIYDVNLFVEEISEGWLSTARVNCLIPHQEWFTPRLRSLMPRIDWVLCKTSLACGLFREMGCRTALTGFTTLDRYDPAVEKDFGACIHVAGSSLQKGTSTVNAVWAQHPEWPTLRMFWYEPTARVQTAPNIDLTRQFLLERDIRFAQNRCGIHVCPSEAEGFGHYLVEAMSCGALVVTTDAPPMNELVRPDRGVLVGYDRTDPRGAGLNYYVDPVQLGTAMDRIWGMGVDERRTLGVEARSWFLENDRIFRQRFWEVLQGLA